MRTLQESEVTPVGATKPVSVDLRVLAATHHNLDRSCEKKSFRSDLFARLNGFVVRLLPLRERPEDLGMLIGMLLLRSEPKDIAALSLNPTPRGGYFNTRGLRTCAN